MPFLSEEIVAYFWALSACLKLLPAPSFEWVSSLGALASLCEVWRVGKEEEGKGVSISRVKEFPVTSAAPPHLPLFSCLDVGKCQKFGLTFARALCGWVWCEADTATVNLWTNRTRTLHTYTHTHAHPTHRHSSHIHTLSLAPLGNYVCGLRWLCLATLMCIPFAFLGTFATPPLPATLPVWRRLFVLASFDIVCRLSPSPALTWQWVRVALCLMACVVPLDLTAVASAVNAACCVLRRLPVSSACPTQH